MNPCPTVGGWESEVLAGFGVLALILLASYLVFRWLCSEDAKHSKGGWR